MSDFILVFIMLTKLRYLVDKQENCGNKLMFTQLKGKEIMLIRQIRNQHHISNAIEESLRVD